MRITFILDLKLLTFVVLLRLLSELTVITEGIAQLLGECDSTFSDTPFHRFLLLKFDI